MSTLAGYEPLRRQFYFTDEDGVVSTTKREDEVLHWSWDWSDAMASGETVSSATYDDSGITRTNEALSSNITSGDVTGVGEFEVTIVTSDSHKIQKVFRFYAPLSNFATDYT